MVRLSRSSKIGSLVASLVLLMNTACSQMVAMNPLATSAVMADVGSEGDKAQHALPGAPSNIATESGDTASVELGVRFQSDKAGQITGVRFYRTVDSSSGFTASLFNSNGQKLASASVPAGSAKLPGYVNVKFSSPISIQAGRTYVASYHAPNGAYAYIAGGLSKAIVSGDLTLLSDSAAGGNGVYSYSSSVTYPTSSYQASNYLVDVDFVVSSVTVVPTPTPAATPVPTPAPTPGPTPVPTPGPTPVSGYRDPVQQPFSNQSFWNIPIGSGATFQSASQAETADLLNTGLGNRWIGMNAMPVGVAKSTDPVRTWNVQAHENLNWIYGGNSFQIPTTDYLSSSTITSPDGWSIMVEANGQYFLESWLSNRNSDGSMSANYIIRNDLKGLGYDPNGAHMGVRATGYSMMGGLVRKSDFDSGRIAHAIAMVISTRQANGYGARFVWPAYYSDSGIGYTGHIPLGALFAIPASVNLNNIGITTPEGMMMARALQEFGGYVSDTAGASTFALCDTDFDTTQQQIDNLFADLNAIIPQLRMVTNNSQSSPGGPGTRIAAPPAPLAP